ncbi:SDR family oxidoreductase [Oryzobacter terrae]|uniref:SDR family oxidoreductase n=1 Tax=Oryzobacter terrae TaxID=1620385 RepID=UPI0036705B72
MTRVQEAAGSGTVAVHDPVVAPLPPHDRADDPRPVLVVGASGKTGRAVTAALVGRGVPVRAAVRPGRADGGPSGSEPVTLDLVTGEGLEAALAGVRAAYHLAPNVHPDEVGIARRVAEAARGVGLPHLVFHSVLHPDDDRMPHHTRKLAAESVLREGLPGGLVVLRPSAYHQNLLPQVLDGEVVLPYGADAPFTTVDLEDVAEAAAVVLLDTAHAGEVHDLCGPEVLTTRRMVELATEVLGRGVRLREIGIDAWRNGPGAALPVEARDVLAAMFTAYDDGGLVGDATALTTLLAATGRRPTTWARALTRTRIDQ